MKKPLRKGLSYTLSIVVGVGLLGGVLYYVGWRNVLSQINALGIIGAAAVFGDVVLAIAAWILSWWVILRAYGVDLRFRSVVGSRLTGYAVSYITPSLYFGGEPIRAAMVVHRTDAPTTRIVATIVVERFLGGASLLLFILIGVIYAVLSPQISPDQKHIVVAGVGLILVLIIIGMINFAGNFKWISRAIRLISHILPRFKNGINRAADKVSETEDEIYNAFTRHWRGTLLAFAFQVIATFFTYVRPQVFFYYSDHIVFNFAQLSLLFTLNIILSFFLWITPGGMGTGEMAMIGIFHLVAPEIGKEGAVTYSLMFKFFELIFVAIGLMYLFNRGIGTFRRKEKEPSDP
jgi:uncharacterized protein (TIRG00374 family)